MNNLYAPGLTETVTAAIVASDDTKLSHLLAMALREVGVAVKETQSAEAIALEGSACTLFVIDNELSSTDTIGLIQLLRQQESTSGAAMIFLSHNNEVAAYDAGVDLVLSKPISIPLFIARIRSVMRRYRIIL